MIAFFILLFINAFPGMMVSGLNLKPYPEK
jgi:hypothetical protein